MIYAESFTVNRCKTDMRVAFFVRRFPAVSQTFILRQITGLIDLGHEIDIYAMVPAEGSCIHPEIKQYGLLERTTYVGPNIPRDSGYWEMPVWPITGKTWLPGGEKPILNVQRILRAMPDLCHCLLAAPRCTATVLDTRKYGYQAASLSALYRLSCLLSRSKRYDVLHAHFGPVGNTFRFARDLWKAPLIVTFHGYDMCTVPRREGTTVYDKLFNEADLVTAHSDHADNLLQRLGCPPAKLRRLRVGVQPSAFPFRARCAEPGRPVRLLTVARLVEIKGLSFAIQAVAEIRRAHPEVRYDIVGEGDQRPHLQRLINSLDLEHVVTLQGARDGPYVRDLMASADIFVLPSINRNGDQEGTPVSLMEAQASGLPVVATRTGGIPEVVLDGKSGFLVPDSDAAALAERIGFLIAHPECWSGFGRAGRRHVEDLFNIERLNVQLVSIYEESMRIYRKAGGRC